MPMPWTPGTFIIPSLGQFEIGDQSFVGLLDGFGACILIIILCYAWRVNCVLTHFSLEEQDPIPDRHRQRK